jgi:hypothetical protein
MIERGATEEDVIAKVEEGERFPARFGRTGFRRNFPFGGEWRGRQFATKQVEAYAVEEDGWLVITVIVKYF